MMFATESSNAGLASGARSAACGAAVAGNETMAARAAAPKRRTFIGTAPVTSVGERANLIRIPNGIQAFRTAGTSVAEGDAQVARGPDGIGIRRDALDPADRLLEGHGPDLGRVERDHRAGVAVGDGSHGRRAEPERDQPVVRGRRAAPLQVAEHDRPGLDPGPLADLAGDAFGDPSVARGAARR